MWPFPLFPDLPCEPPQPLKKEAPAIIGNIDAHERFKLDNPHALANRMVYDSDLPSPTVPGKQKKAIPSRGRIAAVGGAKCELEAVRTDAAGGECEPL